MARAAPRCGRRRRCPRCSSLAARLAELVPVVVMCYANPIYARGLERFADQLAASGASGLIVPDLPLEEAEAVLRGCDAARARAGAAGRAHHARGAARAHRPHGARLRLRGLGDGARRASARASTAACESWWPRTAAHTEVPVAVGFGISTPDHARAAAEAGADGVIVGTRLVRAAGRVGGPRRGGRRTGGGVPRARSSPADLPGTIPCRWDWF